MKNLLLIILTLHTFVAFGQLTTKQETIEREGFVFGFGVSSGIISITDSNQENPFDDTQGGIGFPNLKFGWMVDDRLAILGTLSGMNYEYQYEDEDKDRRFNTLVPTVQYWVKDRWWINGGVGLAMDFPALYEVDEVRDEEWNWGYAFSASTGFELTQRKRYTLDLQTNFQYGKTFLDGDEHRDAVVFSVGLGFNWY